MSAQGVRTFGDEIGAALRTARARLGVADTLAVLLAALSMRPLLEGAWWFPRTVAMVVAIALAGAIARSLRLPAPLQPVLQAITLLVALTVMFAREEALWGVVPVPAALGRLRDLAAEGRAFAEATVPPAGYDEGLLLLIVAGVGLIALAVDTLSAGLDLPGLTLVPLASLFLVPWAINDGSAPLWAFVAVAIGWLGILSATQRDRAAQWSPEARPGSAGTGLVVAAVTTALAILAGGLVTLGGPASPIRVGTGLGGGGGGAVELDALVSLRRSLVNNDDRLLLTYATTAPRADYLRMAVLEEFDGETWRPAGDTTLGAQPPAGPTGVGSDTLVEYRMDVGPLSGPTLPSPSGTLSTLNDWDIAWDQRTSLPVRTDGGSVEGERIGLVVAPPTWDSATLRAASTRTPTGVDIPDEDIADPAPLVGPDLPALAQQITADATTPYDQAVALQRWFTSEGGFAYSTAVTTGAGEDALATFLEERVGYCEQFSATMALMARSVGIPSRVVVGFTQGVRDGDLWLVRGTDAHAWPELWMGEAGWVRFEPTPGNPTTSPPGYTTAVVEPTAAPSATAEDPTANPEDGSPEVPGGALEEEDGPAAGATTTSPTTWRGLSFGVLVLLLVLVPAVVRVVRRRRRMGRADGESAFHEVADTLLDLGMGSEQATPRATVAAARAALLSGPVAPGDEVQAALDAVLGAVEHERYAAPRPPAPPSGAAPGDARPAGSVATLEAPATTPGHQSDLPRATRTVRSALSRRAGWPRRVRAMVLPRSVLSSLAGADRPGEPDDAP